MKTIGKFFFGVIVIGLLFFNISLSNISQSKREYSLDNIKVLKATATEYYCDCKTTSSCTYSNGTITASSYGNGWVSN
jgi:hypothetical protein